MRDAIGGTMLFWIVLFFMTVFISLMAVVIQYARVYKIKNSTIEAVERNEGLCSMDSLTAYLANNGYKGPFKICYSSSSSGDTLGGYYAITLYARFAFSNFGFDMPVSGETRLIDTGACHGGDIVNGSSTTSGSRSYNCKEGNSFTYTQ